MLWKPELWVAADALLRHPLRIHVAAPELWTPLCDEDWGFAYHLERWFRKLLLEHASGMLTEDPDDADFVYVPHCAMNVYLSWKQARFAQLYRSGLAKEGGAASGGRRVHGKGRPPREHGEGDLLHGAVLRQLDTEYLAGDVVRAVGASAAARACADRAPRCRLLFVNMAFGRDELHRFDAAVGRGAVFITTAGAEPRLASEAGAAVAGVEVAASRSLSSGAGAIGCSCPSHCKARHSLGPMDVVVPFAISHNSTSGQTGRGGRRDLLAMFIGSNTSCSRGELFERWANEAALRDHGLLISPTPLDGRGFDRAVRRARFCLVPDGHWPATQRLPAVIARGCVPVVISNRVELPFSDLIDWSRASVRLHEGRIRDLPVALGEIKAETLRAMQGQLRLLAEAMDYHHPRLHMLLLASLAMRREHFQGKLDDRKHPAGTDSPKALMLDEVRFDGEGEDTVAFLANEVQKELHSIRGFRPSTKCAMPSAQANLAKDDFALLVIVLIVSPAGSFARRSLIRETLAELAQGVAVLGRPAQLEVRFAVGGPPADLAPEEQARLEDLLAGEAEAHGDLARLALRDGARAANWAGPREGKAWYLLEWALKAFPKADLIFKQDDDTIVDWRVALPRLLEFAAAKDGRLPLPLEGVYVGRLCPRALCCSQGRCPVPPFAHCSAGHVYGLSADVARWVLGNVTLAAGPEDLAVCSWVQAFAKQRGCGPLDPRGLLYPPHHDNAWIHGLRSADAYTKCYRDRANGCEVTESGAVLGERQRFRLPA